MALITAAEAIAMDARLSGAAHNTLLDTLILRADGLMAGLDVGRPIPDGATARTLEDATYTLHPVGPMMGRPKALCLGIWPIVSVTSVDANGTALVEDTDYELDAEHGVLWLLDGGAIDRWPVGDRVNEVVVVAGYATTPPGLADVTIRVVRHLWDRRNVQGQSAASHLGDSYTLVDAERGVPASVREDLAPYLVRPRPPEGT